MELNEKLQELRKRKGLTQEELAEHLYVSRTAVSKWESGRGYPNIESLKAISQFFSVSLDDLLSSDELLDLAEENQKNMKNQFHDLVFGLLDVCVALFFVLPLFAERTDGVIRHGSLLMLENIRSYLKISYCVFVIGMIVSGVLILALQNCRKKFWLKTKVGISFGLGCAAVLLFILSLQPYAAVFAFVLLAFKVFMRIKYP